MRALDLSHLPWSLRAIGGAPSIPATIRGVEIPATVPGCVHTDLMAAGLIPDPAVGFNEDDLQWIGHTDWDYRLQFDAPANLLSHQRVDLVFDGLDTIAAISLNKEPLGTAANMFHPHRFDARPALRAGSNELAVSFRAPLNYIREMESKLGGRPVNGDWAPFIFMRKAACNFGWDWGPKVATCGIWKPVRLEAWNQARITSVRPLIFRDSPTRWRVQVCCDLESTQDTEPTEPSALSITVSLHQPLDRIPNAPLPIASNESSASSGAATLALHADSPDLWWPIGSAPTPSRAGVLHPLTVSLRDAASGTLLDTTTRDIAFRTIELDTAPDQHGSAFTIRINDRAIYCQGANWIPEGLWPGQVSPETYDQRIASAAESGMNMLRNWGGGYYEDDAFYHACDRAGIMVWQDFMFACAMYPEEPPYPALLEAEARHQIARLSSHPSVILWCGGNECIWARESWGWKERLTPGQSWGRGYYLDLLPRLMQQLDPTRPYWPNSPWSGSEDIHPNDASHGDRHTWDVRTDAYRTSISRFCSEFGHQSPSNHATLAEALPPEELRLGSRALEHRQRGPGGNAKQYDEVLAQSCPPARSFDEWLYQAQLLQARALLTNFDWCRINAPRCMGALVWQLNDAWPGLSWSLIDSAGRPKLALHALRAAWAPRRFVFVPLDAEVFLYAINDTDEPWNATPSLQRMHCSGQAIVPPVELNCSVPPRGVHNLGPCRSLIAPGPHPAAEFLLADHAGSPRAHHFFAADKDLSLPKPALHISTLAAGPEIKLTIHAETLLKDLAIFPDRLSPHLHARGQQPVTLLPGEQHDFQLFRPDGRDMHEADTAAVSGSALTQPPFLWCTNHFSTGQ